MVEFEADLPADANALDADRLTASKASSDVSPRSAGCVLALHNVTKTFGEVRALRGVDFELLEGEVHALLGQNGAGKSTLVKIMSGVHQPDGGSLEVHGEPVSFFRSPAEARRAGLAVVYQELSLVPSLSVSANIFLNREPSAMGVVREGEILQLTRRLLERYDFPLDPKALVGTLPFARRQMVEIIKALAGNVRVLILDEPTSALMKGEEEVLFDAISRVTRRGVGVIYVTHRLREVFRLSQRITVLRDGQGVGTFSTSAMNMKSLVSAIVGGASVVGGKATSASDDEREQRLPEPVARVEASDAGGKEGAPYLELRGITNDKLHDIDLKVAPGEIVGLAGLLGAGSTEILETIFGLRRISRGEVRVKGKRVRSRRPADAIHMGAGLVPDDRAVNGLVMAHSIDSNVALPSLGLFTRLGWYLRRSAISRTRRAMSDLSIKAPGPATTVGSLSDGNQQKVVFAKWREPRPELLLLNEPTAGVDVMAREEIYATIRDTAQAGTAVLIASSDFEELMRLCDRFLFVVDGRIVHSATHSEVGTEERLNSLVHQQRDQLWEGAQA